MGGWVWGMEDDGGGRGEGKVGAWGVSVMVLCEGDRGSLN